jgi:hypothetical protein
MTDYKDPLKDPIAWRSDTTFTVVALLQHRPASRPVISAVKLAKTHDDAQGEIKRMIDVVTECLTSDSFLAPQRSVTIERSRMHARVEFSDGIVYTFMIEKARWAPKPPPKPGPTKAEIAADGMAPR